MIDRRDLVKAGAVGAVLSAIGAPDVLAAIGAALVPPDDGHPVQGGGVDFILSVTNANTRWGTAMIGALKATNAPAGAYFVLVGEPAGLAVVNG
ncbi:hypothetical protein [Sandarakinorhabdus sp.]|uniref:hypothetical protein n=1 Tax=Sandarakinorhabdus sp. TaxID=1916663 RepID=UPI0033417D67